MQKTRPIPEDFQEKWTDLSLLISDLCILYGVSGRVVDRWKKELGLPRRVVGLQDKSKHMDWKRGVSQRPDEYRMIWMPDHPYACQNGYIREHRYVMEQHIGRYLLPEEVVHHIDGNRTNNDISNLELFANNPEHIHQTTHFELPDGLDLRVLYVDQKMSSRSIAKSLGTSHVAVQRALNRLGIPTRTKSESRRNEKMPSVEQLRELRKHHSLQEIATMLGIGLKALKSRAHYHGVKAPAEEAKNRRKKIEYPDDDTLRSMKSTMTIRQMADVLGIRYYTLSSYLSDRKIHKAERKPMESSVATHHESTPTNHCVKQPCDSE